MLSRFGEVRIRDNCIAVDIQFVSSLNFFCSILEAFHVKSVCVSIWFSLEKRNSTQTDFKDQTLPVNDLKRI